MTIDPPADAERPSAEFDSLSGSQVPPPEQGADPDRATPAGDGRDAATPPPPDSKTVLRRSKTSAAWLGVVFLGLFLILLVIMVLQNTQRVKFSFLGWESRLPLSAALLIAAAAGLIIASIAGSLRILQLRRRVKGR